jgi:hypothetical protein
MVSVDNNHKYAKFWKQHPRLLLGISLPTSHTYIGG